MRISLIAMGGRCLILACTFGADSLGAQTGSGSDVSGPMATSLAGGALSPLAPGNERRTRASADSAITRAVRDLRTENGMVMPATGRAMSPALSMMYARLLTSATDADMALVEAALGPADTPEHVHNVARTYSQIGGTGDRRIFIASAIRTFNAMVANASVNFLESPPEAFLVLHAILQKLAPYAGRLR